jgi:hypothetical protein
MKRLMATTFLLFALASISFAQSSNLYKLTSTDKADVVLKIMNDELKLTQEQFSAVRDLLYGSAKSQMEQYARKDNQSGQNLEVIVTRQTQHIEGNLKQILGDAGFAAYTKKKASIEERVKAILKN